MVQPWETYLRAPSRGETYRNCRMTFAPRMAALSDAMRRVIGRTAPARVACLGAGMLNDIPYDALVDSGADIHLVDWLPNLVESGVAASIIRHDAGGRPDCLYCHAGGPDPRLQCRNFVPGGRAETERVCDNYVAVDGQSPSCGSFVRGDHPHVHGRDVTAGYASAFGREIAPALSETRSWRHAFKEAGRVAERVRRHRNPLDIEEGSIDLVTSSMVISQFEHEPYTYFSRLGMERFGIPTPQEETRLADTLEKLRDRMLVAQLERHFDEIARLMSPRGVCFISFETFHYDPALDEWILVPQMHKALDMIGRRFDFDFDILPASETVMEIGMTNGRSIIALYALRNRRG